MADNQEPKFCYPVRMLKNERVTLLPFNLAEHTPSFVKGSAGNSELFRFMTWGPFANNAEFEEWYQSRVESKVGTVLFAVFVNEMGKLGGDNEVHKGERKFAGIIGLEHTDPVYATTELGLIVILPQFHRTFVATNAIGLLLHYMLDMPQQGALGLRRVQWQANTENEASIRAAKRLGFVFEGVSRWQRILPKGKSGIAVGHELAEREGGTEGKGEGRHSAILAFCWDDWAEGRENVTKMMNR